MRRAVAAGQWALLLAPAAAMALFGWARRWIADDAFIDLRVVQHLLAGYGPVFNAGERVEAYTSALWVGILAASGAATRWLGGAVPLEWLAAGLGLGCAVFGVAAATLGAAVCARHVGRRRLVLPLGALVVVAIPAYWDFATSGLETGLILAWLGASYWWLSALLLHPQRRHALEGKGEGRAVASGTARTERPRGLWPAALIGLGPLVRPDLAVISGMFVLLLLVNLREWRLRRVAGLLIAAGLLPALYQVFRMGYFAAVVPNTALAKEAALARWDQGWRYLADFAGSYWLWVPLLPLGAWWLFSVTAEAVRGSWRRAALMAAPVAAGLLHGLYVIRVGGDFMHARMLLPSLFAMLLPVAAVAGTRWWQALLPACIVVPWTVAAMVWLRPPYHAVENGVGPQGIADERTFYVWLAQHPHPVTLDDYRAAAWKRDGDALRERAGGERALALGLDRPPGEVADAPRVLSLAPWVPQEVAADRKTIGVLGYSAGLRVRVVDRLGLADPLAARLRLDRRDRPGHEKVLPEAWVIARFAAPGALAATAGSSGARAGSTDVQAAQAALACGDLPALLDAVQQPVTASRFARNLLLAWRLSGLRIPAQPVPAQAELCAARTGAG